MQQPTTFHVPIALTHAFLPAPQEPSSVSDRPTGGPGGPTDGRTGVPDAPGGGPGPSAAPCGGNEMFLYMGVFLALMYFMVIRPDQRRRREQQALLAAVKQGDHVVTANGMHGIVARLTETTVTLRVDTVHITFDRVAIARIERDEPAPPPAKG